MRNEKGITLLSLVITIIILIIISSIAVYTATGTIRYSKFSKAKSEMKLMVANVNSWYEEYNKLDESEKTNYINSHGVATSHSSCDESMLKKTVDNVEHLTIDNLAKYRYLSSEYLKNSLGLDSSYEFLVNIEDRDLILFNGITYDDKTYYTPEDFGISNVENTSRLNTVTFIPEQEFMENNMLIYNIKFIDNNGEIMDVSKFRVEYQKQGDTIWNDVTSRLTKCTVEKNENGSTVEYEGYKFPINETGVYNIRISTIDKKNSGENGANFKKYTVLAGIQEEGENNIILYGIILNNNGSYTGTYTGQNGQNGTYTVNETNKIEGGYTVLEGGVEVTYPAYRIAMSGTTELYNFTIGSNYNINDVSFEPVPPKPAGYARVTNTNLDTGYVITGPVQNGVSAGNEYVWIEVPQTASVYVNAGLGKTDFTDTSSIETDLLNYAGNYNVANVTDTYIADNITGLTQTQYNDLKKSVLKSIYQNGGFWIGRYEAGKENGNLVCKINATPYNNLICKDAETAAKSAITDTNFSSNLLFGVQWQLVLKYLETKGAATVSQLNSNSTSWGNYKDTSFTLKEDGVQYYYKPLLGTAQWRAVTVAYSGYITVSNGIRTKASNKDLLLTTGASDTNKKMNIYDLAGNVSEYTLESTKSGSGIFAQNYAIARGGAYSETGKSAKSTSNLGATTKNINTGFRVAIVYLGN